MDFPSWLGHGCSRPRSATQILVSSNMDENLVKYIITFLSWHGEQRLPTSQDITPPKKKHTHTHNILADVCKNRGHCGLTTILVKLDQDRCQIRSKV